MWRSPHLDEARLMYNRPAPTDAELARYLTDECAVLEARSIEGWLAEDDANRARLAELRIIWNAPRAGTHLNTDALWSRVRARTTSMDDRARSTRLANAQPRRARASFELRKAATVAAGMIVVVGGVLAISQMQTRSGTAARSEAVTAAPRAREYSTGRGEHVTIQLSDGSRATLAPLTRLRILPGFGTATRDVELRGEAILDVAHDASRPFRVHTSTAVAQDLGTRFDIRAYTEESTVTVAVAEGAVSLGRTADSTPTTGARVAEGVVIRAGSLGRLDGRGRVTTREALHLPDYFGWTSGNLAFNDMALEDVQHTLERWYAVRVLVDDPALRSRRLTARFEGQSVHSIVNALAITLDADAQWRGAVVTLTRR
jgi:transmembrane sensor